MAATVPSAVIMSVAVAPPTAEVKAEVAAD